MKEHVIEHLVCVTDNCNKQLTLECAICEGNNCIEGFLHCNACGASYPIINGVPIIVDDFVAYISQRTIVLGRWLRECKSAPIIHFLHTKSREVRNTSQNRYEEGGAWFKPYQYMHSPATTIDKHFSKIVSNSFSDFYRYVSDVIAERFSNCNTCLDLGCATGVVSHELAKQCEMVFGVDQSYSFINEARKEKADNMEFLVVNSRLPSRENKFDLVVMLNILDLVNPEKLLSYIRTLLKQDGTLLMTDPYDFRDEKGDPKDFYDGKSIREFLAGNGFAIDSTTRNESYIPWVLRINSRGYLFYFADLIIAKRSV